jgi:transcription elongation factor GreA
MGSKVTLKDLQWDEEFTITLVGDFEADPANDLISITSPLGEKVVSKKTGDEFEVEAPAGMQRYRVVSVS